jgi:hypothetical protein
MTGSESYIRYKVQKPSNPTHNIPGSEPFRIERPDGFDSIVLNPY